MERKHRFVPSWRTVAVLALGIAVGVTMAATPATGHITGVPHTAKHMKKFFFTKKKTKRFFFTKRQANARFAQIDDVFTKAESNARFLRTNGKAANADRLDGIDSSGFLRRGGKAADADKLDGLNSTAFLRDSMYQRFKNTDGGGRGNDDVSDFASCDQGDPAVAGGYWEVDGGTQILGSRKVSVGGGGGWQVQWKNNATADTIRIIVYCVDRDG